MDLDLTGKVALVTGASRGIGLAIAKGLAEEGVKLVLAARGADALNAAARQIEDSGAEALAHSCDVADDASVAALAEAALARFGRVDIVISNASALAVTPERSSWDASLSVDLMGAVRLVDAFLPGMRQQGEGVIIFTSSVSGIEAAPMDDYAYTSAKAALNAYSKKLAGIEGPNGIRVNALLPGSIEFPGGGWEMIRQHQPELYNMVKAGIPFGRLGTPEEVADAAVWLASRRARWVTGASLVVDGGQSKAIQ
jgi:3-oxoacyl-[acyl-carrier protein] reductase